ncbi:hypothetical protein PS850_05406 [Pseudomonas fluorescens]|nr:hypothetical protein PS850_05406 [Pseudomonas fluorescens]
MPTSSREILLGRYHYDPLDRLVDCAPFEQAAIQRYYCKTRLSTELQGTTQRTIVQHDDQLLAQQKHEGDKMTASLLATDQQRSVLNALDADQPHPLAYTPYGHRPPENVLLSLLGFTGERPDPVTGHYHLGNGYRQFSPGLMRFTSPDSWSPFGEGGLNAYAYCEGDPVNRYDPTGHAGILKAVLNTFGRTPSRLSVSKSIKKLIPTINDSIHRNKQFLDNIKKIDRVQANNQLVNHLVDSGNFGPSGSRARYYATEEALKIKNDNLNTAITALENERNRLNTLYDNLTQQKAELKQLKQQDRNRYLRENTNETSLKTINKLIRDETSTLIQQRQISMDEQIRGLS